MIQLRTTLLVLLFAACLPTWAASVLIVTPFAADDTTPNGNNANAHVARLQGIFSSFDYGVQRSLAVPDTATLARYDQVWDVWAAPTDGNPSGKAITADEIQRYVGYMASGKRVVVFGDHIGFPDRNNSVLSLIQAAGGGTLTFASPTTNGIDSPQIIQAPFTGPNSIGDGNNEVTFIAPGGVASPGTGQFISIDGLTNRGTALVFRPGTLSNARAGTLIVIFDQNIMDGDFRADYLDYGSLLHNIVAYAPPAPSGATIATVATGLGRPFGVAVHNGAAYVPDPSSHTVWKVDIASGTKTTVAGTGEQGFNGDGVAATLAQLDNPSGVAVDASGALYIADTGNHVVRKIAAPGEAGALITTVAGIPTAYAVGESTLAACANLPADMSQCAPATGLRLFGPRALALDSAGNLYIADRMNQQIKKLYTSGPLNGFIFVVAGVAGFTGSNNGAVNGPRVCPPGAELCFPAARFNSPVGVAVDASGKVFVADEGNNAIRVVFPGNADAAPSVSTLAAGALLRPTGVAVAGNGDVYIANYGGHVVLARSCAGDCTTGAVAGTGTPGAAGTSGGPATAMQLNSPIAVALDGTVLYIADLLNARMLAVNLAP